MTTTKSFSEKSRFFSMYRSALKGQAAFAIVAAIAYVIMIPLVYFVTFTSHTKMGLAETADILTYYNSRMYLENGAFIGQGHAGLVLALLVVLAFVIALVQNAHLHSKKMTDLYHSLPLKRRSLLSANMLASMTTLLAPYFAVYLLTVLAQVLLYGRYISNVQVYVGFIVLDIVSALLAVAVVYIFTTFIAVNVGTVFDNFALAAALGFLPTILYAVVMGVWSMMTYGAEANVDWIFLLSPFTFIFQRFVDIDPNTAFDGTNRVGSTMIEGILSTIPAYVVWLVIGAALLFGSFACYNRRRSEIAEQTQPTGVFQTICKCFGAFCGAAFFFAIFYNTGNMVSWVFAMLCGAVLIGTIVELILSRGVRALMKNLKWLVGAGVLCCIVVLGARYDFTGYSTRVPAVDAVESVTVNYRGRFESLSDPEALLFARGYYSDRTTMLTDPESIAVFTEAHRLAVNNQPPKDFEENAMNYNELEQKHPYYWMTVNYQLKDGRTMTRRYNRLSVEAIVKLADLEDKDDFIRANHALFFLEEQVNDYQLSSVTLYDSLGGGGTPHNLPDADMTKLTDAVRADMLAESLSEILDPSTPAEGYLEFTYRYDHPYAGRGTALATVVVTREYTKTLAVLRELDLLDEMEPSAEIDQVVISPSNYQVSSSNSVFTAIPSLKMQAPFVQDSYSPDYAMMLESQPDIQAVVDCGRAQMFSITNGGGYDLLIAAYYSKGEYAGMQLVRMRDLPQALQAKVVEQFGQPNESSITEYRIVEYAQTTVAETVVVTRTAAGCDNEIVVTSGTAACAVAA